MPLITLDSHLNLCLFLSLDYEIFAKAPCQVNSLIERVCWFTEWFSLHFQAVHPIPTDIDIDIELISCFLFEISLEKLPESGTLRGGLSNAPHVRVSSPGINLYNFQACIVCTFYWLIKNQEMHANNARQGGTSSTCRTWAGREHYLTQATLWSYPYPSQATVKCGLLRFSALLEHKPR